MVQLPISSIGVWIPESFPGPPLGAEMELGVGWGAYSLFKAEWDKGHMISMAQAPGTEPMLYIYVMNPSLVWHSPLTLLGE